MSPRRVAVTGVGVVSAIGLDAGEFWKSLALGRCGIGPLQLTVDQPFKFSAAAQAAGFDPHAALEAKEASYLDRFAQMGMVAAHEALRDARISWTPELKDQTAIVTGTSLGGKYVEDEGYLQLYGLKHSRFNPMSIPRAMMNALTSHISVSFGITGPAWTVSTACSSASHAIGQAFELVRNGGADLAITGGAEAPFTQGVLRAWEAMRVVSPETCRPFSHNRSGLILGEGAAILVLEPLDAALARGAHIYAELAGFGMSSDAHHITQPSAAGAVKAMRAALRSAGLEPGDVGYINAHGTATLANDATETAAIKTIWGEHTPPISSTKSMHGHALGAAGALEAVATVLALHHGLLPPTANFMEPAADCPIDCIPNEARPARPQAALSNSFAFGGLNAVLAFRQAPAR